MRGALAQMRVGLDYGRIGFRGGSEPASSADSTYLEPFGPDQWRVHLGYNRRKWAINLAGTYSRAGLNVKVPGLQIIDQSGLKLYVVEAALGRQVASIGEASTVWIELGPSMNVWAIPDEEARYKFGGVASGLLRQRLSRAFDTNIRLFGGYSPTFLEESDNVPGLKFKPIWRYGLSVGLDFKF